MSYQRIFTAFSTVLAITAVVTLLAVGASADWNPGDEHKMHWPQLPDPEGWDVFSGPMFKADGTIVEKTLADDWRCSETGFVSDVHLWGSWKHDDIGEIRGIHLSIHDDVPAGADPNVDYSHPGELLWERDFFGTELVIRDYGIGSQGWYNPNTNEAIRLDHHRFHQINITDIKDPFVQDVGKIYWLDVAVFTDPIQPGSDGPQWGWKTTQDHFNDDAVWGDANPGNTPAFWNELRDPDTTINESLDLGFVLRRPRS